MLSLAEVSGEFLKLISYVIQKYLCPTNMKILQVHWSHLCIRRNLFYIQVYTFVAVIDHEYV